MTETPYYAEAHRRIGNFLKEDIESFETARNNMYYMFEVVGIFLIDELKRIGPLRAKKYAQEIKRGVVLGINYRNADNREKQQILDEIQELEKFIEENNNVDYPYRNIFMGKLLPGVNGHLKCGIFAFAATIHAENHETSVFPLILNLCEGFIKEK